MIYRLLYIFIFFFSLSTIYAQEVQVNGKNSYIIVMPDGNYEAYDAKNKEHQKAMKFFKEKEQQQKKIAKQQADAAKKAKKQQEMEAAKAKKEQQANVEKAKKESIVKKEKLKKDDKKKNEDVIENKTAKIKDEEKTKKSTTKKEEKTKGNSPEKVVKSKKVESPNQSKTTSNTKKESSKPVVVKDIIKEEKPTAFSKLAPEKDVMQNPPQSPCSTIQETVDDFTKKKRRESTPSLLFQFTDEAMKKYYEGEDFVTCYASMSSLETGYKYINLDFSLASDNVSSSYGWLEKDNHLIIKFLDGTTLTLFNSKTDRGTVDNVNRITAYRGIFPIGSGEEKLLLKGEVDAIRVAWSTGTEDYEIYDVDFFANLLKCFKEN